MATLGLSNIRFYILILIVGGASFSVSVNAEYRVTDYRGKEIVLEKPATRIIATAPHIVENIFSAGAGDQIVGAVDYCDYPEAAKSIPRVGAISGFSLEAIVDLKPDLIVLWRSGRSGDILNKLEALGFKVYANDPRALEDVPRSIRDFGILTGNSKIAEKSAQAFEARHQQLKSNYSGLSKVSTLYQVWNEPLQTLNGDHIISDVIRMCGGRNVFADAVTLAPKISIESVIARDPETIIASGMGEQRPDWLDEWKKWGSLTAVKRENLYFVPPDIIQRHTMRILDGAALICEHLQAGREKRPASP